MMSVTKNMRMTKDANIIRVTVSSGGLFWQSSIVLLGQGSYFNVRTYMKDKYKMIQTYQLRHFK